MRLLKGVICDVMCCAIYCYVKECFWLQDGGGRGGVIVKDNCEEREKTNMALYNLLFYFFLYSHDDG